MAKILCFIMITTLSYSLRNAARFTTAVSLVALLAACGATPVDDRPAGDKTDIVITPVIPGDEVLDKQDEQQVSAQEWFKRANQLPASNITQRDIYLLRAVDSALKADDTAQAEQYLNLVRQRDSHGWQLAMAQLQMALKHPAQALDLLILLPLQSLTPEQQASAQALLARAYARLGNHLEAARLYEQLDSLYEDAIERDANQAALWEALNNIDMAVLTKTYDVTEAGNFRDWLELTILSKQAQRIGGTVQLDAWQKRHPLHPAVPRFISTLRDVEASTTPRPKQIALLLPLSGKIAQPARAIREGFLAAYYRDQVTGSSTSVRVYDVDENNVTTIYQQAISEGADFVVGPLAKQAVKNLGQQPELPVPTLVLNSVDNKTSAHSRLYQFALRPEAEARQVAERIWLDGHNNGVVLYPQSAWGDRVSRAFREHWEYLGGKLVETQSYSLSKPDYAKPVREAMNIDDSKQRFQKLKNLLGNKLEFEDRRRQDVDFVFIAALPEQARQLRPQLKFYKAGRLPVYATSHVYTGKTDRQRDRDMNGIIFADMPWNLRNEDIALYKSIAGLWQSRNSKLTRFFAFGVDAYNIIPHLQRLQRYPFERYRGHTGILRMDNELGLQRRLSWARFRSGRPQYLEQSAESVRFNTPQPAPGAVQPGLTTP